MNEDLLKLALYSADKDLPDDIRMAIGRHVTEELYRRKLVHPIRILWGDSLVNFLKGVITDV